MHSSDFTGLWIKVHISKKRKQEIFIQIVIFAVTGNTVTTLFQIAVVIECVYEMRTSHHQIVEICCQSS